MSGCLGRFVSLISSSSLLTTSSSVVLETFIEETLFTASSLSFVSFLISSSFSFNCFLFSSFRSLSFFSCSSLSFFAASFRLSISLSFFDNCSSKALIFSCCFASLYSLLVKLAPIPKQLKKSKISFRSSSSCFERKASRFSRSNFLSVISLAKTELFLKRFLIALLTSFSSLLSSQRSNN